MTDECIICVDNRFENTSKIRVQCLKLLSALITIDSSWISSQWEIIFPGRIPTKMPQQNIIYLIEYSTNKDQIASLNFLHSLVPHLLYSFILINTKVSPNRRNKYKTELFYDKFINRLDVLHECLVKLLNNNVNKAIVQTSLKVKKKLKKDNFKTDL